MKIGVFDDGLAALGRRDAYQRAAECGIEAIEIGVGGWRRASHADLDALLRERPARDALVGDLEEFGLELACVNAAGNPLHPDEAVGRDHSARLRGGVELAAAMGISRVVTMSGCPGGPGGGALPIFAPWALNCDYEDLWNWQWENVVRPFWSEFGEWLRDTAPTVTVCLELHPGAFAYSPGSFESLRKSAGAGISINLDPSHFWWQGIDPAATVRDLGPLVGHVHAKDVRIYDDRVRKDGLIDFRYPPDPATSTWTFAAVGAGQDDGKWRELLRALADVGYDAVISIEHEDPEIEPLAGIGLAASTLGRLLRERSEEPS